MCVNVLQAFVLFRTKARELSNLLSLLAHLGELTKRPLEKVGADIFTIAGEDYLILVDYFSNFWEINRLQDCNVRTVRSNDITSDS